MRVPLVIRFYILYTTFFCCMNLSFRGLGLVEWDGLVEWVGIYQSIQYYPGFYWMDGRAWV